MQQVDESSADTTSVTALAKEGKFLTFSLGTEEYGLELGRVREIIAKMDITITPVPNTAPHERGVMNLRGQIIPVIDLRMRFGMAGTEDDDRNCIIVVEADTDGKTSLSGVLVDAVSEVLFIAQNQIEHTPLFDMGAEADFMQGLANTGITGEDGTGSGIKILLNIDTIITTTEPPTSPPTEDE